MKGYKGKIGFYKNIEHDYLIIQPLYGKEPEDLFGSSDYIYLEVSIDVDVEFKDTRQQEVDAIDKQITQVMAEYENRLNILRGKKQELLALESDQ